MARWLEWNEVLQLSPDKKVWIQYVGSELQYDCIRYDEKENELLQDYFMTIYPNASNTYRHSWVIWDKLPTEEQFFNENWRLQ